MTCVEFEDALADYLDGTLSAAGCVALEAHVAACPGCKQFMADASAGFEALKAAEPVTPPPDLITHIAYQAPVGRIRRPFERRGWFNRVLTGWVQPILQPRFAMGMAMTVLSFAMLERCTGIRVQRIGPADLNPIVIWHGMEDRAVRMKDRTVKYYENIRFVYDIETRLRDMEEATDQNRKARKQDSSQTSNDGLVAPPNNAVNPSSNQTGTLAGPSWKGDKK